MKFLGPQNSIEIHDLLLSVNWISRMKDEKYWFLDPNQKNLDAHGFVAKNDPRLSGFCYGFQRSGGTSQLGRLTYGDLNEHWRARIPITSHEGKVVGETVEVKSVRAKEPVWIRFIGESVSFDFIDE